MIPSIRLNLLKWLIAPLLAINLVGAGLTYWLAWIPAQVAFDQSVADAIWALLPHLRENANKLEVDLSEQAEQVLRPAAAAAVLLRLRPPSAKTRERRPAVEGVNSAPKRAPASPPRKRSAGLLPSVSNTPKLVEMFQATAPQRHAPID